MSKKLLILFRFIFFFRVFQIFALITSALILSINVYFISDYVFSRLGSEWYIIMVLAPITFAYVLFVLYLVSLCVSFLWLYYWNFNNLQVSLTMISAYNLKILVVIVFRPALLENHIIKKTKLNLIVSYLTTDKL